jgi:hypothetical protein
MGRAAVLVVVCLAAAGAYADRLSPNIVSCDVNFSYSNLSFDCSTRMLTGLGSVAAVTFEPTVGGATYPIFNLSGAFGGEMSLEAKFLSVAYNSPVDALFWTDGDATPDIVLNGEIPSLGITRQQQYTGTLLTGVLQLLELSGEANAQTMSLDGYFLITGGDLVTAGYFRTEQSLAMRSFVSGITPTLGQGSTFNQSFTGSSHMGELGGIPEPATLLLLGTGAAILAGVRRRRGK